MLQDTLVSQEIFKGGEMIHSKYIADDLKCEYCDSEGCKMCDSDRIEICPSCYGAGYYPKSNYKYLCRRCKGTGEIK